MSAHRLFGRLPLLALSVREMRGLVPAAIAIALLVIAWNVARKLGSLEDFGLDAHAYWAVDVADPYRLPSGTPDAFLYSPPFVYVFGVLHELPWPVFHALWLGVTLAALVWLAREWTLQMLAIPPVFNEVFFGNINLLIAVVVVLGLRRPAAWAFVFLRRSHPRSASCGLRHNVTGGNWRSPLG